MGQNLLISINLVWSYLTDEEDDGGKAKPAVERVHVADRRVSQVMRVKHSLQTHSHEDDREEEQWTMQDLHVQFTVITEHSVHHDSCK